MKPYYQSDRVTLYHGDSLAVLPTLDPSSIDAVVTDPPYGLSFMGKRWDYDVPTTELWAACREAMKPGAHLLAFAGTRTQHRMCVRIEDAGFEIRDMIAWVYGSGFPKSLDVSKAIDKTDASEEQRSRRLRFTEWVRSTGVSSSQIDAATGTNMGGHYTTAASQPAIMTREHLEDCRHLFGVVPKWVEQECDIRSVESKNFAARDVVGSKSMTDTTKARAGFSGPTHSPDYDGSKRLVNITAPSTPAARRWSGWGTALKPAMEPITVARKPLIGTVAENVQEWGTGAINVDGGRVAGERVQTTNGSANEIYGDLSYNAGTEWKSHESGRWPANLIHDGGDDATSPMGSASRFFYCAKVSRSDREAGCEGLDAKRTAKLRGSDNDRTDLDPVSERFRTQPSRKHHPTVKPTDLMRYLCRLVTQPDGLILDPFLGSGSTGKAAIAEGFRFVGIERDEAYCEIAAKRIQAAEREASERLVTT